MYAVLLAVCLGPFGALASAGPAQAAARTITNGTQFTDTSGNIVHAHGGGVIKVGSYHYWFGEDRNSDNTFTYVDASAIITYTCVGGTNQRWTRRT